jgi:hypothetical protein
VDIMRLRLVTLRIMPYQLHAITEPAILRETTASLAPL